MDVRRPCHCNDRILRLNPIPKAQENLIRFRAENAGNHDVGPLRRLARSARSFLTKTHTPLEILWPEELAAPLCVYLDVHRPLLVAINRRGAKLAGDALWVSSRGSPLTEMTIYNTIPCTHRKLSAKAINPHLFHDAAATTLAIADPAHVRVAAPLLGDRTSFIINKRRPSTHIAPTSTRFSARQNGHEDIAKTEVPAVQGMAGIFFSILR
jgi:hypothetical protein